MSQYPMPPLELADKLQMLCGSIERSLYSIAREIKESDEQEYEAIRQLGKRFNIKSSEGIKIPDAFEKYDEAYDTLEKLRVLLKAHVRGKTHDTLSRESIERIISELK